MAFITLSGTLLDPNGDLAVGDQIRFTHKSTTGETVESAVSLITVDPAGAYSLPLQYGLVLVEYKDVRTQQFKNLGVATVNQDNPATSIPELLNALVPASSAELIEFQAILADCVTAQTAAENAATTAEAFAYQLTTTDLIASTATFAAATNIPTSGFTTSGDGGNGSWKQNGITGQTPSQTPEQLGNASLLNDGNGNQWALIVDETVNFASVGGIPANDNSLVFAAVMNYISVSGKTLVGDGKTYGLTGSNEIKANCSIRGIRFEQKNPLASTSTRTLTSSSVDNIKLDKVFVGMGSEVTAGVLADGFAGVYIVGGKGHRIIDLEITGNGNGHGLSVISATDFQIVRPYIHDIAYSKAVTDDTLEGIRLQACSDFQVYMPEVKNLHGDFGNGDTTRYTRGMAITGCERYSIGMIDIATVDQGLDQSGDVGNGNLDFTISGGNVNDCFTWGVKFASSSSRGAVSNVIASNCGYGGFVCSGGDLIGDVTTSDIDFIGCKAVDTGSNGEWAVNNPSGFLIQSGSGDALRPHGIKYTSCKSIDTQLVKTMVTGFKNQVAPQSEKLNECFNCESVGHTTASFEGIHFNSLYAYNGADQTIPSSTSTTLNFSIASLDPTAMVNGTLITPKKAGTYRVEAKVSFEANATGIRSVELRKTGSPVSRSNVEIDAPATGKAYLTTSAIVEMVAGDYIEVEARQESGVPIDVLSQGTSVEVSFVQ
jgi:hypothetical protein